MVHTSSEAYCKEMLMLLMSFTVRLLQMARRVQSEGDSVRGILFFWFFLIFFFLFFLKYMRKRKLCVVLVIFPEGRL